MKARQSPLAEPRIGMSITSRHYSVRWCPAHLSAVVLLILAGTLQAATPELRIVLPRGGQRGTELDITLEGQRLADAQEILLYSPGITVTKLEVVKPDQVKVHIQIAKEAAIGEHQLRVRAASGISELRTFYVGPFPIIESKKPNNDFAQPQKIDLNVTVAGVIENEQVNYFAVEGKKGQRITAEVHGMRLGAVLFDPYVAILDTKRFELAVSDDTALAMQDSIASALAPADGTYVIQIRETSYGGGGDNRYLLHVGNYPRPLTVYPLGGKCGEDLAVQFLADVGGPIAQTIKLPAIPTRLIELLPEQNGLTSPSPNFVRASPFPNVLEVEPNNDAATATRYEGELPVAFNGIVNQPGDVDFFRFKAKKDQALDIHVIARQLRSPLDSVLTLYNAQGGGMASNDDSGGPDSYLRFSAPSDGEYVVSVTDHLHQGGPDYTYRIEITPVKPTLALSIPEVNVNSQERQTIAIPRGNRFATLVRGTRTDFGGELTLSSPDLPNGVKMLGENMAANLDVVPVVFEAAADAPVAGKLCELSAKPGNPKIDVQGHFNQHVDLVVANNNQALYVSRTDKLAVAVTAEAPFKLHIIQPKVPLVQGGEMKLKVVAERAPNFKAPISVRMLFNPPGVNAVPSVDMPGDKSEIDYPLSAQDDAQIRKWKICVLGVGDSSGPLWVSSELNELEVAPAFVQVKLEMAAAERGKPALLSCAIDQKVKFDGPATVKLMGLPTNTSAADQQITAADKRVTFTVMTDEKSPLGQQQTLFCQVIVMRDGEPIVHNQARGSVLRIDPPPPPKSNAPAVVAAPPPPPPKPVATAERPLTRLEKLRLEAGQK